MKNVARRAVHAILTVVLSQYAMLTAVLSQYAMLTVVLSQYPIHLRY